MCGGVCFLNAECVYMMLTTCVCVFVGMWWSWCVSCLYVLLLCSRSMGEAKLVKDQLSAVFRFMKTCVFAPCGCLSKITCIYLWLNACVLVWDCGYVSVSSGVYLRMCKYVWVRMCISVRRILTYVCVYARALVGLWSVRTLVCVVCMCMYFGAYVCGCVSGYKRLRMWVCVWGSNVYTCVWVICVNVCMWECVLMRVYGCVFAYECGLHMYVWVSMWVCAYLFYACVCAYASVWVNVWVRMAVRGKRTGKCGKKGKF